MKYYSGKACGYRTIPNCQVQIDIPVYKSSPISETIGGDMDRMVETNVDDTDNVYVEPCVKIRNAYKRYSPKSIILKGLNMTVPQGFMYVT